MIVSHVIYRARHWLCARMHFLGRRASSGHNNSFYSGFQMFFLHLEFGSVLQITEHHAPNMHVYTLCTANTLFGSHILTNDMTDGADMMRQRRQLYALGNVLSRRFHMCLH